MSFEPTQKDYQNYEDDQKGEWGNGIKLNMHFDFVVDETGDIAGEYGLSEYEKDVSWRTAIEISDELGKVINKNQLKRIEIQVDKAIKDDPRTTRSAELTVEERQEDTITIMAEVVSSRFEQYNAVFEFIRE